MRMELVLRRDDLLQSRFDFDRRLARRHPGAVGDPENMRVDGDGRFAESGLPVIARPEPMQRSALESKRGYAQAGQSFPYL